MATDTLIDELRAWLADNWDPELTVAAWWDRLGTSGWAAPGLPPEAFGRGLSRSDAVRVAQTIGEHGALPAPGGLGMLLAAPTIATHGTPEQVQEYVKPIVTGQRAWCQLFSEPGAGSDLAGLTSKAIKDGDEWIVNGQKVWTSAGQWADLAMLLARTNPDAPKHQGISYFVIDMHQPGVELRPLREMTGHAMFNEVFMTDARVRGDAVISGLNNGWAVANTTLMFERAGLSSGGAGAQSAAIPGQVAGHLSRAAGEFVSAPTVSKKPKAAPEAEGPKGGPALRGGGIALLLHEAKQHGVLGNADVRQGLASLYTLTEIGRMNNERVKAARMQGKEIGGMANIGKLSMSNVVRLQRDLGLRILGAHGMLHAYDGDQQKALDATVGDPRLTTVTNLALYAQAPPIYGGTDQIQKNIIGERVLGLAKEPGNDAKVPFSTLPKNG